MLVVLRMEYCLMCAAECLRCMYCATFICGYMVIFIINDFMKTCPGHVSPHYQKTKINRITFTFQHLAEVFIWSSIAFKLYIESVHTFPGNVAQTVKKYESDFGPFFGFVIALFSQQISAFSPMYDCHNAFRCCTFGFILYNSHDFQMSVFFSIMFIIITFIKDFLNSITIKW